MVKDHLILMASMSDRRQALLETPHVRGRLTVADSIALHHRQELSKASSFVSTVDPWCYSADEDGNEEPSQWNAKKLWTSPLMWKRICQISPMRAFRHSYFHRFW